MSPPVCEHETHNFFPCFHESKVLIERDVFSCHFIARIVEKCLHLFLCPFCMSLQIACSKCSKASFSQISYLLLWYEEWRGETVSNAVDAERLQNCFVNFDRKNREGKTFPMLIMQRDFHDFYDDLEII